MSKAIEQLKSGLTIGRFALGLWGDSTGSVKQQVHDGDTVIVRALGNFGVRFLGVDTPEISFTLPDSDRFLSISNPQWEEFLTDPFAASYPAISLNAGLQDYLRSRVGAGTATNHHEHAQAAERFLEAEIQKDLTELVQEPENFQFFLAFAGEVMDRYGRLLAYVNRYQTSGQRSLDYNNRLLQAGRANPYLIFPNINPFRKQTSVLASIPKPGTANQLANQESSLRQARQWVQGARSQGVGVFDPQNSLQLQAFELRFLAQRRAPNRWVIDLSQNDNRLIQPQNYYTIAHVEDRLFIPEEYVPAFVEAGWQRQ